MLAHRHPTRAGWRLLVQGRIYRDSRLTLGKRILVKGLQRALRSTGESVTTNLFYERIEGFLATPENRRRMYVEIDGVHYRLRKRSRSSGLFSSRLDLPDGAFTNVMQPGASGFATAPIQLNVVGSESISGAGQVFLASPTGLSVISDIDDTIKSTCVTSRREMLAQTFLRPFAAIDGMAEVYRYWKSDGVLFHYVSSSPWQIYSPLQQFLREHDFPDGSMHLRWFRLRDEMFKRWRLLRRKSKGGVIVSMIKRMPDRRFMLVGDSGERDPEIYAKIAAKFKDQVGMVLIRDLLEKPMDAKRIKRIHRKLQQVPMVLFRQSSDIRELIRETEGLQQRINARS